MSELTVDEVKPVDPIVPVFREWAILKSKVDELSARRDKLRDRIVDVVEARGYKDHKGSQFFDLPFPITAPGAEYLRVKRERRVSVTADQMAAERISRSKGEHIFKRVFPLVPTLDVEELYVLLQEGILTADDMDCIFVEKVTYAFRGLSS